MAKEKNPASEDQSLRDMIAQQNQTIASLQAQMALLASNGPQPIIDLTEKRRQDREAWYQKEVKDLSRSCLERTLAAAEERWGKETPERFKVSLVADKGHPDPCMPTLTIPARNEYEAKGRYEELCGILSLATEIKFHYERIAA